MPSINALPPLLLVATGGALGACLRYGVGRWALATLGPDFPWGTWGVNIIGGMAMGLLAGMLARIDAANVTGGGEGLRLLLGVGVLGGFTTFSAFSLELYTMITRGEALLAGAYAVSSVAGSVVALLAGVWLARLFAGAA
jgi:CrcB protein